MCIRDRYVELKNLPYCLCFSGFDLKNKRKTLYFSEFERFSVFAPFCSQKWILGRIWGERNPAKNMILQDHLPMTEYMKKADFA